MEREPQARNGFPLSKSLTEHLRDRLGLFEASADGLHRPGQKDSPQSRFSSLISKLMLEEFGAPRDGCVATIVSVVFDTHEDVSSESIRRLREREHRRRSDDRN